MKGHVYNMGFGDTACSTNKMHYKQCVFNNIENPFPHYNV